MYLEPIHSRSLKFVVHVHSSFDLVALPVQTIAAPQTNGYPENMTMWGSLRLAQYADITAYMYVDRLVDLS